MNDYQDVLAGLQTRRDEIDRCIEALRVVMGVPPLDGQKHTVPAKRQKPAVMRQKKAPTAIRQPKPEPDVRQSSRRGERAVAVLRVLQKLGGPATTNDVATACGNDRKDSDVNRKARVHMVLRSCVRKKLVTRDGHLWRLAGKAPAPMSPTRAEPEATVVWSGKKDDPPLSSLRTA